MTTESKVKAQYDRVAEIYDRRWRSYLTDTLTFLKDYMNLSGNETILDIACGTGELERLLIAAHPRLKIVGVDISEKMLEIAQSKFTGDRNIEFVQASAIALPFPDRSFDIIVTANAFHYFEHPAAALQEMCRVLKPDGKVIVMDWCRDYWCCQILDIILKLIDPAHKNCYTQQELHDYLVEAGFDVTAEQRVRLQFLWGMMAATGNVLTP
ncbi:class I SAM-dependent methyltransferase [Pseudanabaena sp. PCC 6802]|uniref:class I SAM-dependent methyltransferase n=1 Tax=Pseudanabaena sp. PCC 6802 TaxID=118173 RepID=UPI0003456D7C|nr:methyltransferase domain-containing protein [Pseudanabaena sp. PCC 6802]